MDRLPPMHPSPPHAAESPAERDFREWLEAQPPPVLKPVEALADLDTRLRIKDKRIRAAIRKKERERFGKIPPTEIVNDIVGKLF